MRFSTGQIIGISKSFLPGLKGVDDIVIGSIFGVILLVLLLFAIYATRRAHKDDMEANKAVLGRWREVGEVTIRHVPTPVVRPTSSSVDAKHSSQLPLHRDSDSLRVPNHPFATAQRGGVSEKSGRVSGRAGVDEKGSVKVKQPDKVYNPYRLQAPHHQKVSSPANGFSTSSKASKRGREISPRPSRIAEERGPPVPPKDGRNQGYSQRSGYIGRSDGQRRKDSEKEKNGSMRGGKGSRGKARDKERDKEREHVRDRSRARRR